MASTNKDYLTHYIFLMQRVKTGQTKGAALPVIRQATRPGQHDPGTFVVRGLPGVGRCLALPPCPSLPGPHFGDVIL